MIRVPEAALARQRLFQPSNEGEYDVLFRYASPVPGPTWSEPGHPPRMQFRADFNDVARNNRLRGERALIKGRFAGRVGYIFADELEVFAGAFYKDAGRLSEVQRVILDTIDREGPMPICLIKEITGFLVKHISPALQALQQAFIIYEDQVDYDMERAFYILEKEMPDIRVHRYSRHEALCKLIPRWVYLCGEADTGMLKSLCGLAAKDIDGAARELVARGELREESGLLRREEEAAWTLGEVPGRHLVLLESSDFIIRAYQRKLTKLHGTGVLKTLLIDGHLAGCVKGTFRFGPHDVRDVQVAKEFAGRRDEILDAVRAAFPGSEVERYNGVPL